MSSSLDDLEPYEIFQQELESYLNEYKKQTFDSKEVKNRLYIIDTFIEYFCFLNPKSSFNEITHEEITDTFILYTIKKYDSGISPEEVKSSLMNFFNFINSKSIKIQDDLLNKLITQ